ncbi:hypothetical protein SAMN05444161_6895 [Rhizobiales bacterium GAS191]|nr:hypothetical protein SAMN05444161_6895 [Rhizobiales bacterium GAS191]
MRLAAKAAAAKRWVLWPCAYLYGRARVAMQCIYGDSHVSRRAALSHTVEGDFLTEAAIEIHGAGQARTTASRMIGEGRGAAAFSRTGDPVTNDWQDVMILVTIR